MHPSPLFALLPRVPRGLLALVAVLVLLSAAPALAAGGGHGAESGEVAFPPPLTSYDDAGQSIGERLVHRAQTNPFNVVATLIFFLAVVHTFLAGRFQTQAHHFETRHELKVRAGDKPIGSTSKRARLFHYLGEVEVVFGGWALVLIAVITVQRGWGTALGYLSHEVNYTEAMFVVAIMTLAATRPILKLAEGIMGRVARLFGGSLAAWWLTILTLGPLLGSLITEPAAMTLSALLLSDKLFVHQPSTRLKYATLGLLFVDVSVGGTLTSFAAPPVLMVAEPWDWGTMHMLQNFGWKAAVGIVIANACAYLLFRKEIAALEGAHDKRELKARVSAKYLPRTRVQRAFSEALADVVEELGINARIQEAVDDAQQALRARLEERFLASLTKDEPDLDEELARQAFDERFTEVNLRATQENVPVVLPPEERPRFIDPHWDERPDPVPVWVTLAHLGFMTVMVLNAHYPVIFVGALLFFLGFATVTVDYQNQVEVEPPMLVGFFLAGLVIHGGLQGWWIEPVLGSLGEIPLLLAATGLTAFNDNAAITYLSTLVPDFGDSLKYAVVAGAVSGGGLTVIANAPNPAGQALLKQHFDGGINPLGLLAAAILPTLLMLAIFIATG
ncbi:MAG: putative Na+/H+ antiporter [Myxococcota bacterium]